MTRLKLSFAVATVPLLLFCLACGDSSDTGPGGGGSGGAGGEGMDCPVGSHLDGEGVCVATLGGFMQTASLNQARDHHSTWLANTAAGPFLYTQGGAINTTTAVTSVERAAINDDGSLAAWEVQPQLLGALGPVVASDDTRVVIGGGVRPGGVSNLSNTAVIQADGSLSDFTAAPSMLASRFHGAAILHGDFIYASGGIDENGTSLASTERLRFTADGLGDAWVLDTPTPDQRSHHGFANDDNGVYLSGGLYRFENEFANDVPFDTVLHAAFQPDGSLGAWTVAGSLPFPLAIHSSFVHAGQLYTVGGLNLATKAYVSTVQRAPINDDGTLGAWEQVGDLPLMRGHAHQTPIHNGFLYSVSGRDVSASQPECFFAKFE